MYLKRYLIIVIVLIQYMEIYTIKDYSEYSEYSNNISASSDGDLYNEYKLENKNHFNKMKLLDEFIKYMINDILLPIDGIVKGYCLYRSIINEIKYDYRVINKESIIVAVILLSGSWKNPIKFISQCRNTLRKVNNAINTSNNDNSNISWSNISNKRKSLKISRINVCFRARICSRSIRKKNGIWEIRQFLSNKTQYRLIYPNEESETVVWNAIREFKDVLAAGILKGSIYNHFRVLILYNYINKILLEINEIPINLFECIALINTMVRDESLKEWLSSSKNRSLNNQYNNNFDPITNLRYNHNISIKQNIYNFQVRTCIHVIWSSGIMFKDENYIIDESSPGILILRKKITWICGKLFLI